MRIVDVRWTRLGSEAPRPRDGGFVVPGPSPLHDEGILELTLMPLSGCF
jgi:hypothetical protein